MISSFNYSLAVTAQTKSFKKVAQNTLADVKTTQELHGT